MNRKTIALIDPYSSGHHIEYARHAIKAARIIGYKILIICNADMKIALAGDLKKSDSIKLLELDIEKAFFFREIEKIKYILNLNAVLKKNNISIVHFLYGDRFYLSLLFLKLKKNIKYFATCHWFYMLPQFQKNLVGKIKAVIERSIIKLLNYRLWRIMSHSEMGSKELLSDSTYTLNYPIDSISVISQTDIDRFRNKLGISKNNKLILCYGGTRFDKGADIAINALSKLPSRYHLVVAGKELDISYDELKDYACTYDMQERLHLFEGFITNEKTELFFNASDIILVPYRSFFSGQSGPLVTGAALNKIVVSSDVLVLNETVRKYSLGFIFESENIISCANAIKNAGASDKAQDNTFFIERHSIEQFTSKLAQFYSCN